MTITCSKRFENLPFAHRQHNHAGHCRLIHGHNWSFEFTFAGPLDSNGFVVDFGKLKWLREWLEEKFDHTLVLNDSDPSLEYIMETLVRGVTGICDLAKIVTVPNCGAEGLAEYVAIRINGHLETTGATYRVTRLTVFEDNRNSATWEAR
jgi:6-pyruvoyltetrahydropterin/6-carboxytetrahydropterin synthase